MASRYGSIVQKRLYSNKLPNFNAVLNLGNPKRRVVDKRHLFKLFHLIKLFHFRKMWVSSVDLLYDYLNGQ